MRHLARVALLAPATALAVVLAGCGAAEEVGRAAADEAREAAGAAADEVVDTAVRDQVCQVVADGRVSPAEVVALRTAVAGAEAAGAPAGVVAAAREVVGEGDDPTAESVAALEEQCADSGEEGGQ